MANSRLIERRRFLEIGGLAALGALGGALASGTPAQSADQSALTPVRILNPGGDPTLVLQQLLKQQGYLEQLGLDATTENLVDGTKVISGLFSGSHDISVLSGFGQILPAIEQGAKVKILAASSFLPTQAVYSAKPEIKALKDLEGRIVGTGPLGALLHQLMIALFQKHGVDPDKVRFVNVGNSANIFRAVVAGMVDAGPAPIDVYDQQEKYGIHSLRDGDMWTELPEFTFQGAYATDEAIANKRDVLVRVLAAYAKLYRFVHSPDSKDAFIQASLTALSKADNEDMRRQAEHQWVFIQTYRPYAVDLVLSEQRLDYMQRLNVSVGVQKKPLPFNQVADMSLAQEALKLIA